MTDYMDGYLKKNLELAKATIKKDWDFIFVVDGRERSGKSVLAQKCAKFCDPSLTLSRITFTPDQFKKAILEARPYQAVVYDEAYSGLNSRQAMSQLNRSINGMLTRIGRKNLYVFIVLPSFFDLDKYVALWRSAALLHVYTVENFKRGFFAFYNYDKKKDLYVNGKKFYSYKNPRPDFIGRFTKGYVVDEQEYKDKKDKSEDELLNDDSDEELKQAVQEHLFTRLLSVDLTHAKKREILQMPESTYYVKLKKIKQNTNIATESKIPSILP